MRSTMKNRLCLIVALLLCLCSFTAAFASSAENYQLPLYAGDEIYVGPGYEFDVAQTLGEDGIFTIIAQEWDSADNLWGQLKSGAGWVFLRSESTMMLQPIYADFASEELIAKGPYEYILIDQTENAIELAIYANEPLTDVCFFESVHDGDICTHNPLHTLPALTSEKPIVAAVAFWGDMTTYGISFTDASGAKRCFEISLSGVDGSVVLTECSNEHS